MTTIRKLLNLSGRRALITGAGGHLGKVMADTLAELGADLVLVDQGQLHLESLAAHLTERWGVNVDLQTCNLEYEDQREELMTRLFDSGKGLNIVINNAAFVGTSNLEGWNVPFAEQSIDSWRRALEVNLTAVFDICQRLMPLLLVAEGASIINIGSIYGIQGPDWRLYEETSINNVAAYAASKGGLIQFTRWLATTKAPNVRVNAISPGGIFRGQPGTFVERYKARTPLCRMATEDDFRGAVAYLSSDMSNYVTGQNIVVDGGWSVW
jgi:NAD(P)-dependent dehydrogenase (short-subunit alcohol dehydrogenase family)